MGALISGFDYDLPDELIAQEAPGDRASARLMVIKKSEGKILHRQSFAEFPEELRSGDVLVLNNTRVIPARLLGRKEGTGGKVEFLLLKKISEGRWDVLAKPSRRLREGTAVSFGDNLKAWILSGTGEGRWRVEFSYSGDFLSILEEAGSTPLPPYIRGKFEKEALRERYQTVYAEKPGASAAPTAGLHFTVELLERIKAMGVSIAPLTIHTGLDTFRPVKEELIEDHAMASEYYEIGADTVKTINNRPEGARVFSVGTTSTRVLETVSDERGAVRQGKGWTDIYIYPGHSFRCADALITNFHPPRSTTLLLTAAFAGRELLLEAYREAVSRKYRFLSFGDATLIVP